MKISPIQFLSTSIERLRIDPAGKDFHEPNSDSDVLETLLIHRHCELGDSYWDNAPEINADLKSRTYHIRLGLKSSHDKAPVFPYHFEIVASGYFMVYPETIGDLSAADAAAQYGLTILMGTIRETLLTSTARMPNGQFMLPTLTFLDEKFSDTDDQSADHVEASENNKSS